MADKKGFILILVMTVVIIMTASGAGLYNYAFIISKMAGIDEVRRIKGYYAAVAAMRYISALLTDPAANFGSAWPVTRNLNTSYSGLSADLGLSYSENVTVTITKTSDTRYHVDSRYTSTGGITVSRDVNVLKDALYCGSLADQNITGGGPGIVLQSASGVSLPAKAGDVIEVTFCGSIRGNASIENVCTGQGGGTAISLFNQSLYCGGSSSPGPFARGDPIPATWKPFVIKSLYRVTAAGTFTFTQQFRLASESGIPDPNLLGWQVNLYGRMVSARVLASAVESGVTP